MTDLISSQEAIAEEARKLAVDVLYSEKGHLVAAKYWRFCNYGLGIPSAILGVIAGANILAENAGLVSALLALLASALVALNTFLNPSEHAMRHHKAGTSLARLRRSIRQFVQIDFIEVEEVKHVRSKLEQLTEQVNNTQADSPAIPGMPYRKAKADIEKGTAEYTKVELEQAA